MLKINKIFSSFLIILTFLSVNSWSKIPLGNTFITWGVGFVIIAIVLKYKKKYFRPNNITDYYIITIYLVWMLIGVFRGAFIAEGYWEWKQLVRGSLALSLPVFVFVFSNPKILSFVLRVWLKYAIPAFFIFFFWVTSNGSKHQFLGPVLLLACFLPIIPSKKWRYIFIGLLLFMLSADLGARSQVIKAVVALSMSALYLVSKYLPAIFLKIGYWLLILAPIFLLYLGLTGQFNIFKGLEESDGGYVEERIVNGEVQTENLSADTRTDIYIEIIESAIHNNYVIWGRTPARGNDSKLFGAASAKETGGKMERHANEIGFPNIFTWLGVIGLVLYCIIYIKSSFLAMYKSNNIFMKLIGLYIAFRFAYGWVEDVAEFKIAAISLWMLIAIGFSESFRKMTDYQFKNWIKSIFNNI